MPRQESILKRRATKTDTPLDDLLVDAFANKVEGDVKEVPDAEEKIRFKYTLTVREDMVPDGEMLHVWLPFPRKDIHRQTGVTLLSTSQEDHILADDRTEHNSIYMEQVAKRANRRSSGWNSKHRRKASGMTSTK